MGSPSGSVLPLPFRVKTSPRLISRSGPASALAFGAGVGVAVGEGVAVGTGVGVAVDCGVAVEVSVATVVTVSTGVFVTTGGETATAPGDGEAIMVIAVGKLASVISASSPLSSSEPQETPTIATVATRTSTAARTRYLILRVNARPPLLAGSRRFSPWGICSQRILDKSRNLSKARL